jgi:2-dehydro-3-deoxyphosphogluconate aldolase/(4S)-4-hydroxy-2-oxoglutarate aldolase
MLEALLARTIVAVIRADGAARARQIASAVAEAGIGAIEITTGTPDCFPLVREIAAWPRVVAGVGTVTEVAHVEAAVAAGARFVVSPHTDAAIIRAAKSAGLVSIPGAMTPTEILAAVAAGADVVKLFPIATLGGPRFLELIRGPLPHVRFWVSGGVRIDEIDAYLTKGAALIGLTSALAEPGIDTRAIGARAEAALSALATRSGRS